jgi:hypothetical protein
MRDSIDKYLDIPPEMDCVVDEHDAVYDKIAKLEAEVRWLREELAAWEVVRDKTNYCHTFSVYRTAKDVLDTMPPEPTATSKIHIGVDPFDADDYRDRMIPLNPDESIKPKPKATPQPEPDCPASAMMRGGTRDVL